MTLKDLFRPKRKCTVTFFFIIKFLLLITFFFPPICNALLFNHDFKILSRNIFYYLGLMAISVIIGVIIANLFTNRMIRGPAGGGMPFGHVPRDNVPQISKEATTKIKKIIIWVIFIATYIFSFILAVLRPLD